MARKTTVNLPEDLVARLEPYKRQVNVSKVCREALEFELDMLEQAATATGVAGITGISHALGRPTDSA